MPVWEICGLAQRLSCIQPVSDSLRVCMDCFIYLFASTLRCPNKSHTWINAHASKMHVLPGRLYLVSDVISFKLLLLNPWTRVWCIITLSACNCYSASSSSVPSYFVIFVFVILRGCLFPSMCKSEFFLKSEKLWVKLEFVKIPFIAASSMCAAASGSHWRTLRCVLLQEDRDLNCRLMRHWYYLKYFRSKYILATVSAGMCNSTD